MATIGIVCPPTIGHINPFLELSKGLLDQGHKIIFFQINELKEYIEDFGFEFYVMGKGLIPSKSMKNIGQKLGRMEGLEAMKMWRRWQLGLTKIFFNELPVGLKEKDIDFILIDQSDGSGATIAEALRIPFITISIGLDIEWEESFPPFFLSGERSESEGCIKRNNMSMKYFVKDFHELIGFISLKRVQLGLNSYDYYKNLFPVSPDVQIAQMPSFLDYPRKERANFFNVGPIRGEFYSRTEISFPFHKLLDKDIVFISLGSILNNRSDLFHTIVKSFHDIDVQLIISLGKSGITLDEKILPSDSIVVDYAPQLEILSRARLCVTHGGMNTVMDSLSKGVPVLVLPISFDQPGTAARVKYHGVGEFILPESITENTVNYFAKQILGNDKYYAKAQKFKAEFSKLNGKNNALKIIENEIKNRIKK